MRQNIFWYIAFCPALWNPLVLNLKNVLTSDILTKNLPSLRNLSRTTHHLLSHPLFLLYKEKQVFERYTRKVR